MRKKIVALFACILTALIVGLGIVVQPAGAEYRFRLDPRPDASGENRLLAIGASRMQQYSLADRLFAVSYRIEGPAPWAEASTQGCNEEWRITSFTLFGTPLNRMEMLCEGIDMRFV